MGLHDKLATIQADLPAIGKDETADTGKFSYDYATLNTVNRTLLPLLAGAGLTWTVRGTADPRGVVGTLADGESGEQVESWWPLPSTDDPQRLGSAMTYARRYLLLAMVGSAPDKDDDGAAAAAPDPVPPLGDFLEQWPQEFLDTQDVDKMTAFAAASKSKLDQTLRVLEKRHDEWQQTTGGDA